MHGKIIKLQEILNVQRLGSTFKEQFHQVINTILFLVINHINVTKEWMWEDGQMLTMTPFMKMFIYKWGTWKIFMIIND